MQNPHKTFFVGLHTRRRGKTSCEIKTSFQHQRRENFSRHRSATRCSGPEAQKGASPLLMDMYSSPFRGSRAAYIGMTMDGFRWRERDRERESHSRLLTVACGVSGATGTLVASTDAVQTAKEDDSKTHCDDARAGADAMLRDASNPWPLHIYLYMYG